MEYLIYRWKKPQKDALNEVRLGNFRIGCGVGDTNFNINWSFKKGIPDEQNLFPAHFL